MNLIRGLMGIPKLELKQPDAQPIAKAPSRQTDAYIVSKMYNPKRKDEISLETGNTVKVLDQKNGRYFVETVDGNQRGWVPEFCLQKQAKGNINTRNDGKIVDLW